MAAEAPAKVFGRRRAGLLIAGPLVLLLAGCGPGHKTAVITVSDLAFGPAPKDLRVGDTVQWVNKDIFVHSATSETGGFDVELPVGGTGSTVLARSGVIRYRCKYHPDMTGVLRVAP